MSVRLIRVEKGAEAVSVRMSWSSIFTGAFLTLGFGLFFLLLGNAVGLNALNTVRMGTSGTVQFWSWIYVAVTWVFSFYLGGYFCTRVADIDTPSSGVLHGLTSWGLASAIIAFCGSVSVADFHNLMTGVASDAANWLAVCIISLGCAGSAIGGMMGKYSRQEHFKTEIEGQRKIA